MTDLLPVPANLLAACVHDTFGSNCTLTSARPLVDGTRKKVFLLELSGPPGQVVLLAWFNEHDYFDERADLNSPFNDLNAPALYRANTALFLSHQLRVPGLYYFNDSREVVPYTFALVEYVQAQTFNSFRQNHPPAKTKVILNRMSNYLTRMHQITRPSPGSVLNHAVDARQFMDDLLNIAAQDLEGLARAHPRVQNCKQAVWDRLANLHRQMVPRDRYTFIHGELGPDEHLLIDNQDEIVLLDIDGCEYGDLEREHAYLKLRFGDFYPNLARTDLDPVRMQFYELALHISAAYGHYRLLAGGYPGEVDLRQIYEWNAAQVVNIVEAQHLL